MALKNQVRLCVGFLIGDVETQKQHRRGPIGTFFAVQHTNDPWNDRPAVTQDDIFMVTAKHVVEGQPDLEARMRHTSGRIHTWSVPIDTWQTPAKHSHDIAIAPMQPSNRPPWPVVAIPTADAWDDSELRRNSVDPPMTLGAPIHYIGLWGESDHMAEQAIPVVRAGSIAAELQEGIEWHTLSPLGGRQVWTFERAHLIDVRSRGGFSGSPCFNGTTYPGPKVQPIPERWKQTILAEHAFTPDSLDVFGDMWQLGAWWGMFVGHADESGIGAVIPAKEIVRFLESIVE